MDNLLKRLLIVTIVVLLPQLSFGKKWKGYYINQEGDTISVSYKIMTEPGSGDPLYAKLQNGVKCKENESGPYIRINAKSIKKLVIIVDNSPEEFVPSASDSLLDFAGFRKNILIHRKIRGPVTMYNHYSYGSTGFPAGSGAPGTVSGTHTGAALTIENILIKDDGSTLRVIHGGRRKDLVDFFSEYDKLVQKIENKELRPRDIDQIVMEYNVWRKANAYTGADDDQIP
jgi:hypothetical protein